MRSLFSTYFSSSFRDTASDRGLSVYPVVFVLFIILVSSVVSISAQTDDDPDSSAPPPIRIASPDEVKRISAEHDQKDRTKVALDILEYRLKQAEQFAEKGQNDEMYRELGDFCGVMKLTLNLLTQYDRQGKQALNDLKRYDIGLRSFIPRLETLRRNAPLTHESFVRKTIIYLQDVREKALEPMYGDPITPNSQPQ